MTSKYVTRESELCRPELPAAPAAHALRYVLAFSAQYSELNY
jgi:hypothetical protein